MPALPSPTSPSATTVEAEPQLHREEFAVLPDGRAVQRWTFGWPGSVIAEVLDLGARLHALHVPDWDGDPAGSLNIVLAPADAADLVDSALYLGATIGRYGNRIAKGDLPLGGTRYALATQPNGTTLHGGTDGYDVRLWQAEPVREPGRVGVTFQLHSPDGDQGFPGALTATVSYLLDRDGALTIDYRATTDAPTVVNLTNHAYFNLAGEGDGDVLQHHLQVEADHYLPVDRELIPIGPPEAVSGTPFDLTEPRRIGGQFADFPDDAQLAVVGGGFDHNMVLREATGGELRRVATLSHPGSGLVLDCWTTEPGLQVYTGSHFDGTVIGRSGRTYGAYAGIALETQHFPDSPHQSTYPSTELQPGDEYRSTTRYRAHHR